MELTINKIAKMNNRNHKKNTKKNYSYKKHFLIFGFAATIALFSFVASSQSIRAQIAGMYNKQNDQVAGITALMSAVVSHDVDGVRFFSKAGAALVNQKNLGGATALHLACREKDLEIVKILIESGADVNVVDNEGWTPVMRAALAGEDKIVNLLLDNGAKLVFVNSAGESAMYHAVLANCNACLFAMVDKFNFIKDTNSVTLRQQISDSYQIARNHENKEAQIVLDNLLDQLNKVQVLNEGNVSQEKIFNLVPAKGAKPTKISKFIVKKPVKKVFVKKVLEVKEESKIKQEAVLPKQNPAVEEKPATDNVIKAPPAQDISNQPADVQNTSESLKVRKFKFIEGQKAKFIKRQHIPIKAANQDAVGDNKIENNSSVSSDSKEVAQ